MFNLLTSINKPHMLPLYLHLQLTAAGDDYVHNNIRHEFLSVKQGPPGLQDVFRVFTLLLPDSLFTFSAAKYCKVGRALMVVWVNKPLRCQLLLLRQLCFCLPAMACTCML